MIQQHTQAGWVVINHTGKILSSTFSLTHTGAKKKALDAAEQKYNALVTRNFLKWEKRGFKCVRCKIKVEGA